MIDKYLERGEMFVLDDHGIKAECVITKEADGIQLVDMVYLKKNYKFEFVEVV